MLKQVYKVIAAALCVLVAFSGCALRKTEGSDEEVFKHKQEIEYVIGDETNTAFVDKCKELIKAAYAPESQSEFNHIQGKYKDIATELCLQQLTKVDNKLTGDDFGNTLTFNMVRYGYAKHQSDGVKRIFMDVTVQKGQLSWNIDIELDINNELNKVDNIDVW